MHVVYRTPSENHYLPGDYFFPQDLPQLQPLTITTLNPAPLTFFAANLR